MTHQRAWLKGVGIALSVLVGLALLLLLLAEPLLRKAIESARADLEDKLRRPVTLGEVDIRPLSGQLRVNDLGIGPTGHEPAGAPALEVDVVFLDLALWRTIGSLGRRIHVERLEVARPTLNVVKRDDGTLNWGEISERWREEAEPAEQRRRFRVVRGALRDGTIQFLEQGRKGRQAKVSKLDIVVEDLVSDEGGTVALEAAVLGTERNLKLDARVHGMDELPLLAAIHTLTLELRPTPLAPLAPFVSALGTAESTLDQGVLSANAHFKQTRTESSNGVGRIALQGAQFTNGQSFDGHLEFDVLADRAADKVVLRNVRVEAAEMKLFARANLSALRDAVRVEDLELGSEGLDFSRVRALYPPFQSSTEPLELAGPFSIQASGGGTAAAQRIELTLTLTGASIRLEDKLEKPRGIPALARASLRNERDVMTLERGTLQLSTWQLAATGSAQRDDGALRSYTLELTTPHPDVGGLLRLLPPVARAFPEARKVGGKLSVTARIEGTGDKSSAEGRAELAGLDVSAPGTRFHGGGSLHFNVQQDNGELTGQLRAKMSELEAVYLDVINKPKGTPLELDARWKRKANQTRAEFSAKVASLSAQGNATLRDASAARAYTAEVSLDAFRIRPLLALLPAVSGAEVPDVRFDAMKIRAEGVTGQPAATRIDIPSFAARAGRSDLSGSLRLANPSDPQIALSGRSSYLDLDDFLPTRGRERERRPREPSPLAKADGRMSLVVERGRAADVDYRNLDAQLKLENGRATATKLEVEAFGGHFSGTGSEVPVLVDEGPYRLQGALKAVQLDALLARFAGTDKLMTGSLSATFDLRASDTTPQALSRSLTGRLQGSVADARFLPGSAVAAFVDRLRAVPGAGDLARGQAEQLASWQLDELSGVLVFEEGAVVIDEPLRATTPHGPLALRGKLRLAGPVDLAGTTLLQPDSLEKLVGTDLPIDKPLPLEFRMTGSLAAPNFTFGNLEATMRPILQAYLKESLGPEAERSIQEAVRGLLDDQAPSKGEAPRDKQKPPADKKQQEREKQEKQRQPSLDDELRRRMDRVF